MDAVNPNPANPFAPPTAHVSDVDARPGTPQPLKFTTYHGRIGRLRYLAWGCGMYILMALVGGLASGVATLLGAPNLGLAVTTLTTLLSVIFWVFWTIQRGHDMGWRGRRTWWCLIPFVALIWIFKRGDEGTNAYGPPPPRNTVGIHLLAWLLPAFAVIGIIAAIAIPAYQDFTKRAAARQVGR